MYFLPLGVSQWTVTLIKITDFFEFWTLLGTFAILWVHTVQHILTHSNADAPLCLIQTQNPLDFLSVSVCDSKKSLSNMWLTWNDPLVKCAVVQWSSYSRFGLVAGQTHQPKAWVFDDPETLFANFAPLRSGTKTWHLMRLWKTLAIFASHTDI